MLFSHRWKSSKDGNKQGKNYLELMPVENPEANLEWEIPGVRFIIIYDLCSTGAVLQQVIIK